MRLCGRYDPFLLTSLVITLPTASLSHDKAEGDTLCRGVSDPPSLDHARRRSPPLAHALSPPTRVVLLWYLAAALPCNSF